MPLNISRKFGRRGYIPVKGTLNGVFIKGTLVHVAGGAHRLYINTEMRKNTKVNTGDTIHLRLEIDTEPRILPIPEQLRQALENNPKARIAYEKTPPSKRKEILAYLNSLKTQASLEKNVNKVIDSLIKE